MKCCRSPIFVKKSMLSYKHQYDIWIWLSYAIAVLALFLASVRIWFMLSVLTIALIGSIVFFYKIIKKRDIDLFDILGFVFLVIYTAGIVSMRFWDMLLFVFSCTLVVSMGFCVAYCKDEDIKSLAILHVIYIFACNLVMPCIGMSI